MPRPAAPDRRSQVARAALHVLAHHGSRGLTHRAVDEAAGLGAGSVNYYAPTRVALLTLAADELFALDTELAGRVLAPLAAPGTTAAQAVGPVADLVDALAAGDARHRVLARHELLGEARRVPEVRALFDRQRAAFVGLTRALLVAGGCPEPDAHAERVTLVVDALVQRQVVVGPEPLPRSEIEATVRLVLTGC